MVSFFHFIKSVSLTTLANLVGRAANVLIPLCVIGLYGANPHTDIFFFFLALSFYFYGTLSYAAGESTVPLFILSKSALSPKGIVFIGLAIVFILFIVASLWSTFGYGVTIWYAFGFALMAGAGIANGFASGLLNAKERFSIPGLSWGLRIIPVALFALLEQPADHLHFLAVGIGCADWVRLAVMILANPETPATIRYYGPVRFLKSHFPKYLPLALAMIIMGLNPIVDRLIANLSGPGSISILDAGERLFGILSTLCTLGMMTVLLTQLSNAVASETLDKNWISTIKMALVWSVLWLIAGILAGYMVLSEWILEATSLSEVQIRSVQQTYWYYLPGLVPYAFGVVYIKRLQAVQRTWTLVFTSTTTVLLNIPASLMLHRALGVPGIALATSLVYTILGLMLLTAVHWKPSRSS